MSKKKFKDTKFGKIAGKILNGAVDILPGGTTVKSIVTDIANKNLDRNNDGKVTIQDFKPLELAGLFGGLALLAVMASKGIIDVEILKQIAEIFGL